MTSIWKTPQARADLVAWSERFRARIPTSMESRSVATQHGETHVLVGGPTDAPPLVVLHGALASAAHVMVELAPLLSSFRVYAVDIVGQSPRSADARPSVQGDDYGAWLLEVIDRLGLGSVGVVAVSWGGFVATRLAVVAPERVERLALLVPAGIVTGSAWQGFVKIGWPMTMYLLAPSDQRLRAFVRNLLTTDDDEWRDYLGVAFRAYDLRRMRVPKLARPEELREFTAPTMVIAADQDVSFPGPALLERAARLFPGLTRTELLADCRHSPPTTEAFRTTMCAKIAEFMAPPQ